MCCCRTVCSSSSGRKAHSSPRQPAEAMRMASCAGAETDRDAFNEGSAAHAAPRAVPMKHCRLNHCSSLGAQIHTRLLKQWRVTLLCNGVCTIIHEVAQVSAKSHFALHLTGDHRAVQVTIKPFYWKQRKLLPACKSSEVNYYFFYKNRSVCKLLALH